MAKDGCCVCGRCGAPHPNPLPRERGLAQRISVCGRAPTLTLTLSLRQGEGTGATHLRLRTGSDPHPNPLPSPGRGERRLCLFASAGVWFLHPNPLPRERGRCGPFTLTLSPERG